MNYLNIVKYKIKRLPEYSGKNNKEGEHVVFFFYNLLVQCVTFEQRTD